MCLIIVNPPGVALPPPHVANGWNVNNDSAGYMFHLDGKLIIRKPFYSLSLLMNCMDEDRRKAPQATFVIHLRYATHGESNAQNCHPHELCGGAIGLVHNGVLNDFLPPFLSPDSDTVHFCKSVLAYRRPADVMDGNFNRILGEMIGERNKFAMLSQEGKLSIVNEEQGLWENGNWYSNATFRPPIKLPSKIKRVADEVAELAEELEQWDAYIDAHGWAGLDAEEQERYWYIWQVLQEYEEQNNKLLTLDNVH